MSSVSYAPATDVFITGGRGDAGRKHISAMKTYVSPWEKAMKGDENLIATLKAGMPGPIQQRDLPKWKSFNRYSRPDSIDAFRLTGSLITLSPFSARCAMPFGGFEKANQFLKFQLPEAESTKEEPEPPVVYQHDIDCRPSFNRTPIGWVGSSEPSSIHMETDAVPFDGETDEL